MGQAKSPLVGEGAHPHGGGERIGFSSSIDDVQGWKKGGGSACLGMGERTSQLDLRGLERAARSRVNACSTLGAVIAEAREREREAAASRTYQASGLTTILVKTRGERACARSRSDGDAEVPLFLNGREPGGSRHRSWLRYAASRATALSIGSKLAGSTIFMTGNSMASAPNSASVAKTPAACSLARVITIFLPDKGFSVGVIDSSL